MTITPEQIAANIAATHARRQKTREEAQAKAQAEQAQRAQKSEPFAQYNGKLIGFVVREETATEKS